MCGLSRAPSPDSRASSVEGAPELGEQLIRSLDGKWPQVHPTAFVSELAYVVGDVEIGGGSSIWPGTVVRADSGKITIGRETCIQDNSVVHGDADVVIGDRVVIGHKVLCHARTVGDRTLLGSGAIVNDGVVIGEGSLVASSAMVLENTTIPPGSLVVGVPGRIRGEVKEHHTQHITELCDAYVQKAQRYRKSGGLGSGPEG